MRRNMKEKQGLFAQLVVFWKETIRTGLEEGIGFWMGAEKKGRRESSGELFAAQERTALWQEKAAEIFGTKKQETGLLAQERTIFAAAEKPQGRMEEKSRENPQGEELQKKRTGLFSEGKAKNGQDGRKEKGAGLLWGMERFRREAGAADGNGFHWRQPEEEEERRRIVPTATKRTEETLSKRAEEGAQENPAESPTKREEKQAEPSFDIDVLMGQITKRLWEERESCGRRLRG